MSKIEQVKEDLFARQDIVIVDIQTETWPLPLSGLGGWNETFDLIIAPKKGIYDAEGLENFMLGLTTVQPTSSDSFYSSPHNLSFGKLYFDEEIGRVTLVGEETLTIVDENYASRIAEQIKQEYAEGKRKIEAVKKLHRRTWVCLYPNARIALGAAHEGRNKYGISTADLGASKGRVARLLARLGIRP
jgi:hypothetical protein